MKQWMTTRETKNRVHSLTLAIRRIAPRGVRCIRSLFEKDSSHEFDVGTNPTGLAHCRYCSHTMLVRSATQMGIVDIKGQFFVAMTEYKHMHIQTSRDKCCAG